MKDDLEQLLKSLHLRKIAELFDDEAKRAEKADWPTSTTFTQRRQLHLPSLSV